MTRINSMKSIFVALNSIAFCLILSTNAFSHSGHKHDALPITIPDIVAQVNGQDIEKRRLNRNSKESSRNTRTVAKPSLKYKLKTPRNN